MRAIPKYAATSTPCQAFYEPLHAVKEPEELLGFGYTDPKEIYARDFNLDDPEIDFYIVDSDEMPEFQGCDFSLVESPHCGWHLYGQAPLDALKREIMSHPYRLYPPPLGKR